MSHDNNHLRVQLSSSGATPRQIQRHQVAIRRKTVTGISRLQPEQRDLFKVLNLPAPNENVAL